MKVDFAKYSDEVLLACYSRINPAKFPENLADAKSEILRRGLSLSVASGDSPVALPATLPLDLLDAVCTILNLIGH